MPGEVKEGNEKTIITTQKKKKSFLSRLPKYLAIFIGSIFLLLIILYFFIQTDTFNRWALVYTIKKVNNNWNFKFLFSTKAEEDTTAKPFDWGVIVDNLQIHNGHIRVIERLDSGITANKIKFEHLSGFETEKLDVSNFELDMSARYFIDDKE